MKMFILILVIVVLVIVLGNRGNESSNTQIDNTWEVDQPRIISPPVFVSGVITSNTVYIPMITWREKRSGGGTIIYARPVIASE